MFKAIVQSQITNACHFAHYLTNRIAEPPYSHRVNHGNEQMPKKDNASGYEGRPSKPRKERGMRERDLLAKEKQLDARERAVFSENVLALKKAWRDELNAREQEISTQEREHGKLDIRGKALDIREKAIEAKEAALEDGLRPFFFRQKRELEMRETIVSSRETTVRATEARFQEGLDIQCLEKMLEAIQEARRATKEARRVLSRRREQIVAFETFNSDAVGNHTSIAVDGAIGATAGFVLSLDQIEIRLKEMHPLLVALYKLRR
ncbi:hypothetical protein BDV97DRAFT_56451 [Delphinella strobiligena]|nr:hypothetical protein BDV97DRAFT_56451 [Delphinella strobiligena]